MSLNPSFISALFIGLMASCAFTMDILSSPRSNRWMSLPRLIRWQVRISGVILMVRSIDLFTLSEMPAPTLGQVNWIALWSTLSLATTVVSLTLYAASCKLPARAWDRLNYALRQMRSHPGSVPVMMDANQVLDAHHATGQPAVAGDHPETVVRESERAQRMADRT